MQIEWILNPLTQCIFLALTLIVCLGLFISVKVEIAVVRHSLNKRRESVEAPAAAEAELKLTRRDQALQMQSDGKPLEAIADALRMPRNEVDLMLKLERLRVRG